MGIGVQMLALYRQLRDSGELSSVNSIIELGSQDMHCAGYGEAINKTIVAFNGKPFAAADLERISNGGPAREFYERLGWEYHCIDTDGRYGAMVLDLNFDSAPAEHMGRHGIASNFGTTEHLINQLNAFRVLHDLVKPGGLIFHVVPFVGCVDHGFFNYQPNFFYALARFNSYDILGIWLNPNTSLSSLLPWQDGLLNHVQLSPAKDAVMVVAQRKIYDVAFKAPFQGVYERSQVPQNAARYEYTIDGETMNGSRVAKISRREVELQRENEELKERLSHLSSRRRWGWLFRHR